MRKTVFVGLMILLLIVMVGCGGNNDDKTAGIINWTNAEVTADNVKAVLSGKASVNPVPSDSKFPESIYNIDVIENVEGNKNILIYYNSGDAWDETDFVKKVGSSAIIAGSMLFDNPRIDQVGIFTSTNMTDQYGKTKSETVAKIIINRKTADKIDWKGFSDRHVNDPGNIYRVADSYVIHPGVLKEVKQDKVRLR